MAELEPVLSRPLTPGGAGVSAAVRALAPLLQGPVPSPVPPPAQPGARCLSTSWTDDVTAPFSEARSSLRVGPQLVLRQGLCGGRHLRREPPAPRGTAPSLALSCPRGGQVSGASEVLPDRTPTRAGTPRGPRVVSCQHPPGCPSYSSAWSPGRELHRGGGGRARSPLCP